MIYFKSCTRCTGDRTLERDMYGWYIICLNCGHVAYPETQVKEKVRGKSREKVQVAAVRRPA
jgi:uncharacterized OB-fold protein